MLQKLAIIEGREKLVHIKSESDLLSEDCFRMKMLIIDATAVKSRALNIPNRTRRCNPSSFCQP